MSEWVHRSRVDGYHYSQSDERIELRASYNNSERTRKGSKGQRCRNGLSTSSLRNTSNVRESWVALLVSFQGKLFWISSRGENPFTLISPFFIARWVIQLIHQTAPSIASIFPQPFFGRSIGCRNDIHNTSKQTVGDKNERRRKRINEWETEVAVKRAELPTAMDSCKSNFSCCVNKWENKRARNPDAHIVGGWVVSSHVLTGLKFSGLFSCFLFCFGRLKLVPR